MIGERAVDGFPALTLASAAGRGIEVAFVPDAGMVGCSLRHGEEAGTLYLATPLCDADLAISVVKKRSGTHENTIREFQLGPGGLKVGPPLTEFNGILTGTPTYVGDPRPLMSEKISDGCKP